MSSAIERHVFKRDLLIEKILKIMNALKFSRFCCLFTLREGTILIGIVELTLTSFCLFLFLLGATHAQDIVSLVTSDLQLLEEYNLSEGRIDELQTFITNNEKKMLLGKHLAFIIMFSVWGGLLLTSIYFICCVLLLYGAIRRISIFLLPWTSIAFFSLISGCFLLILSAFMPRYLCKNGIFALLISLYGVLLYSWLTVFNYYQELKNLQLKGFGGVVHNVGDPVKVLTATQSIQTLKVDPPL